MACGNVGAVPSLTTNETWTNPGLAGWQVDAGLDNDITASNPGAGGNPGGYMRIQVDPAGILPGYGRVITTGVSPSDNWEGDYAVLGAGGGGMYPLTIDFDFYSQTVSPGELALYFQGTSGRMWAFDVLALYTPAVGWDTLSVPTSYAGWAPQNGLWNQTQFLADWASVDWLGLYVQASAGATEYYGMDNLHLVLSVPEPETVWMILAVVLSLCITFRARLAEIIGQLKAKTQRA
jgi:hypothetical protein